MTAELIHRLHFGFTITFHYLFPQLTMGLALLIVVLKSVALKTGSEQWDRAARFWGRIFGINFVFGVVTGIPMEFEFGTNWARFARLSGGVIGQPLAMEGVFSFFLESAFLGLFLYGEKRISKLMHWFSAVMVFLGSWISGFFIFRSEGVFSFFLESAFLGLFLYGEKRISKLMHWFSAVMVFLGSWISGFFII